MWGGMAVHAACFFTRKHIPWQTYVMGTASISGTCCCQNATTLILYVCMLCIQIYYDIEAR